MAKSKLLLVALLATMVFAAPKANADVNDFTVNDFHGRYELSNDTHAGRLKVTETIQVTFSDQNHGIERAIPVDYMGLSLHLDVKSVKRDGQPEPYTTYGQANNEVLRIGDEDKTTTGQHTYEIRYEMKNVIAFFDDFDEWYWDINGDQWQQPFEKVSGEVIMPTGWSSEGIPSASCYTGRLGSTQSVCNITKTATGYTFESIDELGANETLTVATPFQKGLFTPRDRTDWYRDNMWQLVGLATGAVLSYAAFRQWYRWGKDYKGTGIVIPEYKAPKNLTPAEVGLLNDYSVDSRDLTATIIDLATRGYIKIHDEEKSIAAGFMKKHEFTLELTNHRVGNLKYHERRLLEALFKPLQTGVTLEMKDINKVEMYEASVQIRHKLKNALTKEHGLLEEAPKTAHAILWGIAAGSLVLIFVSGAGWGWIAGMILAISSSVLFIALMRRRSHAGVKAYENIKGLKLYMNTAEKDRMKMMESVDRPYAEPAHTVEFFEKLLPFAVALGVEKSWAKQFENIYREAPSWYSGSYGSFNTVYFTSSLASSMSSLNANFSTSTSSSSSGSGGGGFSGGGGGGGGGGGW